MTNRKWLKPLLAVMIVCAVIAGVYFGVTGLLSGRGVAASKDDILAVLRTLLPYLIVIGIALLAILAAFIVSAVFKFSRGNKMTVRVQTVVAGLLAILICINLICVGPMSALLNVTAGSTGAMSEETAAESKELSVELAREGIVLLKNEGGALPLAQDVTRLNVFGWSSTNPIYGGTGSGEFLSGGEKVTLLRGLEMAGYEVNPELVKFYERFQDARPEIGIYIQDWTIPEPTIKEYDRKDLFEQAKEFSDVALLVLSRSGGEGADLPRSITAEDTVAQAAQIGSGVRYTSNRDDVDPSKHYLELTNREVALLERLNEEFENIVVIVNAANPMEMGWLENYEHVTAALWCAAPGEAGFAALGEVLNGTVNPSGRLPDTWLYDLTQSPTYHNFGDFAYDNVSELVNRPGSDDNYTAHFVNYVEGIYVGYKFYETAAEEGLIDYGSVVQFPFGYGLSYTTFTQELTSLKQSGDRVTMEVKVTNTGAEEGKDVVEVYFTPPYTNGGIEKASVNLIEFAKTGLLAPGASEKVEVSFSLEDMASYDELGHGCYVLEAGAYEISIRSDAHTVLGNGTVTVDADVIFDDGHDGARSTDTVTAVNRFDFARGEVTYLSRADGFANYKQATAAPAEFSMSEAVKEGFWSNANYVPTDDGNVAQTVTTGGVSNGLTLADLAGADHEDDRWEQLLDQMTQEEMAALISVGGYMTSAVPSVDLKATVETDGPAGLHSNYTDLSGTNFPASVVTASSWNKELALKRGELIGRQGQELGISGWYGPGINIHRSSFSGRNFEYYAEDAALSGIMAAQEVFGARAHNMQTYVKHFALNDQEGNRTGMLLTWCNEQAIREIYLKPFEVAFKQGGSKSVMTSYNYIGHKWAGACDTLLNQVLRGEWGVDCVVVTDWFGGYGYMNADLAIRNGGDRMLTTTDAAALQDMDSPTAKQAMRTACRNILFSIANSNVVVQGGGAALWMKLLIAVDVVGVLALILIEGLYIRSIKKLKKTIDNS